MSAMEEEFVEEWDEEAMAEEEAAVELTTGDQALDEEAVEQGVSESVPVEETAEDDFEFEGPGVREMGALFGTFFFMTMFGRFDIIAIGLACYTAYQVASSVGFGD